MISSAHIIQNSKTNPKKTEIKTGPKITKSQTVPIFQNPKIEQISKYSKYNKILIIFNLMYIKI